MGKSSAMVIQRGGACGCPLAREVLHQWIAANSARLPERVEWRPTRRGLPMSGLVTRPVWQDVKAAKPAMAAEDARESLPNALNARLC